MSDLIDRQAAIDAIEQMQMPIMRSEFPEEQFVFTGMSEALQAIKDLPSAQPERKKGRWELCEEKAEEPFWVGSRCSECNYWKPMGQWNYCPNCGARMEI